MTSSIRTCLWFRDGRGRDPRREPEEVEHLDDLRVLGEADVPVSRVYSIEDIVADPQYLARAMFESLTLPDGRPFKAPAVMPRLSATPGGTEWIGPELGAHTDEVLRALGYVGTDIERMRHDGVI